MKTTLKTILIVVAGVSSLATPVLLLAQSGDLFVRDPSGTMQVDILPELKENVITRNFGRSIPVAFMGSASLDVNSINPRTITFRGVDVMLVGKSDTSWCKRIDLNADGHPDLLCDVRVIGSHIAPATYKIELQAETYDKSRLRGEDTLKIVDN